MKDNTLNNKPPAKKADALEETSEHIFQTFTTILAQVFKTEIAVIYISGDPDYLYANSNKAAIALKA